MLPQLPHLEILPTDAIQVHEHHDDQRTPPLIERLRASGVLRNPPIVTPFEDGSGRYMVLDGANRTTALRRMGFPHVLAQVVSPDDPGLDLKTWNHVLWEWEPAALRAALQALPGVAATETDFEAGYARLNAPHTLVLLALPDGQHVLLTAAVDDLRSRIRHLNAIVDAYKDRARLDRTNQTDVRALRPVYRHLTGLVIFPHFEVRQVMAMARAGTLFPAGITRFTISPRALRLNYPLAELAADRPLEEKNAALQRWIQERIARKGVRYYAEATFLFDE